MAEKKVEKSNYKVQISFREKSAIIFRPNLPFLADTADLAVHWLFDNGYKPEEVEVIGEKPESWYKTFPKKESDLEGKDEK